MISQHPPIEAFDCPACQAILMPPLCCCEHPHEMIVQCPDCAWWGVRIVTRGQPTTTNLHNPQHQESSLVTA